MDNRELSLKFLGQTGLIPVKVRPKQKDPFPEWDPRTAEKDDKNLLIAYLRDNKDLNIGALFAGRYVDLDIDNNNPRLEAALDFFLPFTPYIWGRKSKPRSHMVFTLKDDFNRSEYGRQLRYIKGLIEDKIDDSNYSLELRGGKVENGLFSVLPGSIHPDGEKYEWAKGCDPTIGGSFISVHHLMKTIRLAIVAAIISQYWVEGSRNDVSLALAGLLWRIQQLTFATNGLDDEEDIPEDVMCVTRKDAKAIFECVMEIAQDDPEDKRSRMLNLDNTWRKLEADPSAKVSGGGVLKEIIGDEYGKSTVKALYLLLSDTEGAQQLEELAEQFVIWYGAGTLIDLELVKKSRSKPWMSKEQAKNSMGGMKVKIGNKSIPTVNLLFGTSIAQRVYGLTFDPSQSELIIDTGDGTMVNQWRGFKEEPSAQTVLPEQVAPFTKYVYEIVAKRDDKAYMWVMSWLADIIQNPGDKSGTSLVLLGVQGAGKSFLGERIMGPIIGGNHYGQINSVEKLTNKFNTNIDNKILIQCDEAIHSYQRDVSSRLKAMITDESIVVEPKGVDSYDKPNHMRLLFTSNEDTAAIFIDPSPHERRFTVLHVSPERATDIDYWEHMHEWVPVNLSKIMRFLLDWDYDRKLVRRPYATAAKRDIQRVGVDAEVSWILSRISDGFIIGSRVHQHWFEAYNSAEITEDDKVNDTLLRDTWPDVVSHEALERDYKDYVRSSGRPVYTGSVMTSIRKVMPEGSMKASFESTVSYYDRRNERRVRARMRLIKLPDQVSIIEHLREKYGAIIDDLMLEMQDPGSDLDNSEREEF